MRRAAYIRENRLGEAESSYESAAGVYEAAGHRYGQALVAWRRARLLRRLGAEEAASEAYAHARARFEDTGDRRAQP